VVMDSFPTACFATLLWNATQKDLNEDGCKSLVAKQIEHYNSRLRVMVTNLNPELAGADLIIFSLHDIFMSAIRNPSKYGLKYVHKACCGWGGGEYNYHWGVKCGKDGIVDGELRKATVCENRSEYMLWDHLHPTEAFAFHIAQAFLRGEHMQPPFYIKETCRHEQ
jgi:phospholipase/lecithinase/hemolysin